MTAVAPSSHPIPKIAVGAVVLSHPPPADRLVLLVRRANPPMENRWSLPGGRLEFGERIEDALKREIWEECGIDVDVGPLLEIVEIIQNPYHYVILDYLCFHSGGQLKAGDDAREVVWVRPDDITHYGVTDAVERVVAKALAVA